MSQENVEIVRRVFESWQRGDFAAGLAPDAEIVFSDVFPDPGTYRMGSEVAWAWQRFRDAWEQLETVGEDARFIERGERVVALYEIRGTGKASGAEVAMDVGNIMTLADGMIVRMVLCSREEALEAAGLRE